MPRLIRCVVIAVSILSLVAFDLLSHRSGAQRVRVEGDISCIVSPPGQVSWWAGEGNANDIRGDNNGTLVNGATFAAGEVEQAFSFDGTWAVVPKRRLRPCLTQCQQ